MSDKKETNYVIEMRGITKDFPSIRACDDITLNLKKGEIHALLGENGAGKSTLMSVLFGLYKPESGEIYKDGQKVEINGPNDANALGIGMVHQHFKLVEVFTVTQNIILGRETGKFGVLDMASSRQRIVDLADKYGFKIDPDAKIEDISVGQQQRVEILKMLYRDNEILIFDEPTAVLTPQEIKELMQIMRNFVREGKSILFITHKLNEILAVADRCTVLRKGKLIGTVDVKTTNARELSRMMVGRDIALEAQKKPCKPGETVLEVKNLVVPSHLSKNNAVKDVSLKVRAGEIVCIAGIEGNGQTELIHALSGISKATSGSIEVCGRNIFNMPVKTRKPYIGHIPEDRHKHGLILEYTLAENLVLQVFDKPQFRKAGFILKQNVNAYADKLIGEYDIRSARGAATVARSMSGGNQQKAIVARELDKNPPLLIAAAPTRGLDVGAIEYIHKRIISHAENGGAVLFVSLELDEVMNISDRIYVMYGGEVVGEFNPKNTDVETLGLYMAGGKRDKAAAGEGA